MPLSLTDSINSPIKTKTCVSVPGETFEAIGKDSTVVASSGNEIVNSPQDRLFGCRPTPNHPHATRARFLSQVGVVNYSSRPMSENYVSGHARRGMHADVLPFYVIHVETQSLFSTVATSDKGFSTKSELHYTG